MNLQGAPPAPDYSVTTKTSIQERRPLTLKYDDTFAVFDRNGDILPEEGSGGIYYRDTRHLSHFELLVGGGRPLLLSSIVRDDNAVLTCDLTNPDIRADDEVVLEHDIVHLRRSKFLYGSTCFERLSVHSFSPSVQSISVRFRFHADFADLFEVRGMRRDRRGEAEPPVVGRDRLTLAYRGLDGCRRITRLRFHPEPLSISPFDARFELELPPDGRALLYVEVSCLEPDPAERLAGETFALSLREARRSLRERTAKAASVATSNEIFNEAARRSVSDLAMLTTDMAEGPYPYAGIPWFSTPFGRDAIITAYMMLWLDPHLARGVLRYLAANQATGFDPEADAEPGKILHEVRHGEMAELGEVPFRRYYGSIDSTPLFVLLAGAYLDRTCDLALMRDLWPSIQAAVAWMDEFGDRDRDGFIEYGRRRKDGLVNQGWKDSHDSIFHADGSPAEGPIALAEVQAYAYAARLAAGRIARALGDPARAHWLEDEAAHLRSRFREAFWCEELGTFALALDGHKRRCEVRSSNAGQTLFTGIAEPEEARRIAAGLLGSSFFSGWGVRTIASGEARFNPMAYHNGSVWPHDNALIAIGFARYGLRAEAARIFEGLFDASAYMDLRRLPELFCGFPRRRGQGPTSYPVACSPQAWSAATPFGLLRACLNMSFDCEAGLVIFERPILPAFLQQVTIRRMEVGGSRIDLLFERVRGEVSMRVIERHGQIRAMLTA